jgi:hypothetical protein
MLARRGARHIFTTGSRRLNCVRPGAVGKRYIKPDPGRRLVYSALPVTNSPRRELALVLSGFAALTAILTFPLVLHPGTLSYELINNDSQFSIWNVAWVARTLVLSPLRVFDANIFYPHRWTLAYSETNLGAGALAAPVYWATRNVYAAHNAVLLLSFLLSATLTYYLVKYLVNDRRAAVVAAISFAYCPHVFAHLPHIQLLMTAGLPGCLLAFHRMADQPTGRRGVVLGAAMAAQAYFCAYYAVFALLLIGFAVLFVALSRQLWRSRGYWTAVAAAAGVAIAAVSPLVAVYAMIRRTTGFSRSVEAAGSYAANWSAYLASSSYSHAWMLAFLPKWNEVLFPGFVALTFGIGGLISGWLAGRRWRELSAMYGSLAALACWESFGPGAGLYRLTYAVVPGFSFLRAPSRFGLLVVLSLSVLAAIGIARLLARMSRPMLAAVPLALLAAGELLVPLPLTPTPGREPAYEQLARLPYGALIELPVYSDQFAQLRARYMLGSTVHWMPLVDAYSDYIPEDFLESVDVLGEFPTMESLARLERDRVRYALIHVSDYTNATMRAGLRERMKEFSPYLREIYADDGTSLYEIPGVSTDAR